jgi:prepilin-type N-terminal cleavage/methylation domain-containing protein
LKTRANSAGFTLIEVLIAMAIVGITAVVLLDQRIAIVQDAGRARDMRTCWILASQKMAELELDKTLWVGLGTSSNGDFADVDPDYGLFNWEYSILREVIDTTPQGEAASKDEAKKRELYRLTLTVRAPGINDPIILEAEFPVAPPKPPGTDPAKDGSKDGQPATGQPPASGTTPDGALRK